MTNHPLRLYNTLTRRKETFKPFDAQHVRMYVCGPTVYDFAHIGNARPVVVFDVLWRLLKHLYPSSDDSRVSYVRNITDIDDKIITAAKNNQKSSESLTESFQSLTHSTIDAFHEDMDALGVLRPTHEPRATEHIKQMIELIKKLLKRDYAYLAEEHVLFHVPIMRRPRYGFLSRNSQQAIVAGARVEIAPYKKHPTDFVLWKPSKPR